MLPIVAVLVAAASVGFTSAPATDRYQLRHAAFGMPFRWVNQDESALSPPASDPWVDFGSPKENPTQLHIGLLLLDIVAWMLLLLVAAVVAREVLGVVWLRSKRQLGFEPSSLGSRR